MAPSCCTALCDSEPGGILMTANVEKSVNKISIAFIALLLPVGLILALLQTEPERVSTPEPKAPHPGQAIRAQTIQTIKAQAAKVVNLALDLQERDKSMRENPILGQTLQKMRELYEEDPNLWENWDIEHLERIKNWVQLEIQQLETRIQRLDLIALQEEALREAETLQVFPLHTPEGAALLEQAGGYADFDYSSQSGGIDWRLLQRLSSKATLAPAIDPLTIIYDAGPIPPSGPGKVSVGKEDRMIAYGRLADVLAVMEKAGYEFRQTP